jgi:putative ABC transport system substrate-binding protein
MRRCTVGFMVIAALGILVAPLATPAQKPANIPRIGYLSPASSPRDEAFRQGLRELGYVEGQNLALEVRFGRQLHELAAELVGLQVDVIVAVGTEAIRAAQQATQTIPIIMAISADPAQSGFVASLGKPGGNITGLTNLAPELRGKWLELLKEVVPGLSRVAVLVNPANPSHGPTLKQMEVAAHGLGLQLQGLEVRESQEFESALTAATQGQSGALSILGDPMFGAHAGRIAHLAIQYRLPTIFQFRANVKEGGLMSYGPVADDLYRRAAGYVDKILKGAKPVDLPVEQPMRFELVLNRKTAQTLGVTFPSTLLVLADEVLE